MQTESSIQSTDQLELRMRGERVALRGDGTLWLPQHRTLLAADLHLGKDAVFRNAGVPVPMGSDVDTLQMLGRSIRQTGALRLIVLGDLIHHRSGLTSALMDQVAQWRSEHDRLIMQLVLGNHDRHIERTAGLWRMQIASSLKLSCFDLVHRPDGHVPPDRIRVGGHWHPVVLLRKSGDRLRCRCFVIEARRLTLPAFGPFKGGLEIRPQPHRAIYPCCDSRIWYNA